MSDYPAHWDLSVFYDSVNSGKLATDKHQLSKMVDGFVSRHCEKLSISTLPDAIYEFEEITKAHGKIYTYLNLNYCTNVKDTEASAAQQEICEWWAEKESKLSKFVVLIQSLNYEEISKLFEKDSEFAKYKPFIDEVFRFKKHTLSAKEEAILSKTSVVSGYAWDRFHEGVLSRIEFNLGGKKCGLSEVLSAANSGKTEKIRREASIALSAGLKNNSYALLSVINNIILSHRVHNEIRGYQTPSARRFIEDDIPGEVVDTMLAAVTDRCSSICHRYYKLKAKLLGKEKLQYWDRCSPVKLKKTKQSISYDMAVETVLSVFNKFSKKFFTIASDMVNKGWVDVFPADGKVTGAFACGATVDTHPFILLNFDGTYRDILTMAHEFGHGIHNKLSSRNKQLTYDAPLNMAETASTFAEKLTNKHLLENESDAKRKLELICSRLDDVMSTVFRQVAFFKFEQILHKLRKQKELSYELVNKTWRDVIAEMLGDAFELDHCIDNFWGYITHFTSSPFYVYSYAFGCLFVEGLFAEYEKNGKTFVERYEEALSCGGTKNCTEIAGLFGINLKTKEFWNTALDAIENEVNELEALCDTTLD